MRASCSTGPTDTWGYLVTVGADDLGAALRPDDRDDDGRVRSAGAGRASTVFFEQIGQSAVKRLCRQKREVIGYSEGTPLPTCLRCWPPSFRTSTWALVHRLTCSGARRSARSSSKRLPRPTKSSCWGMSSNFENNRCPM